MKALTLQIAFVSLAISGCASKHNAEAMLDQVDAAILMPERAKPLGSYARYYKRRPDGKIEVILLGLVKDDAPKPRDYGCSMVTADDGLKDVPCPKDHRPRAGERRWISQDETPSVSDADCDVMITEVYDPSSRRIIETFCG